MNQNYSDADHKDWADIYNYGRTHFGVHPERLPFSTLQFDILHMTCQITRKLLDFYETILGDMALIKKFQYVRMFLVEHEVIIR